MNTSYNYNHIQSALRSLLLLTVVLVAWPVYADDDDVMGISGKITEISLDERFIVVNDTKYKIPLSAKLFEIFNGGTQRRIITIYELQIGQDLEFRATADNDIAVLKAYEKLPE